MLEGMRKASGQDPRTIVPNANPMQARDAFNPAGEKYNFAENEKESALMNTEALMQDIARKDQLRQQMQNQEQGDIDELMGGEVQPALPTQQVPYGKLREALKRK